MKSISKVLIQFSSFGVSRIKINDSKTYNSLSIKTLLNLRKSFKILEKDPNTKVIIIEGLGKGFSAGHNLKEVRSIKKKFILTSFLILVQG